MALANEELVFPFYFTVGFCSDVEFGIWCNVFLLVMILIWWWTWFTGVVYGVFAPASQRSVPFLEEHERNELKTVKEISDMSNGSAPN